MVNRIYGCNDGFFKEETEASFYWAGFIAADGCISEYSNRNPRLRINLSQKDYSHLEKFCQDVSFEGEITTQDKPNTCCVGISSKTLCEDLERFNVVPRKTYSYTFPDWIKEHKLVNHFMRGYFDGDGWLSKHLSRRTYCFGICGMKSLVHDYKTILETTCQLSIEQMETRVKDHADFRIYRLGKRKQIKPVLKFLYQNATIYLDRKKQRADDFFENYERLPVSDERRQQISKQVYNRSKLLPFKEEVLALKSQGVTHEKIGEKFGYDRRAVSRFLKKVKEGIF